MLPAVDPYNSDTYTVGQVHFIFRHKNPITGEYEEKHLSAPPRPTIEKTTNLYTLILQWVFRSYAHAFSI
jgi:hypothetical protein